MSTFRGLDELVKNRKTVASSVKGNWSHIRWTPDFATGEQLAIGIMLNINNRIYTQFIDDFERLECLYDKSMSDYAKNIIALIEETLQIDHHHSISDQIIYDYRGFAQGKSVEEILMRLFERVVPLGRPHGMNQSARFQTIRTSNLWTDVQFQLKERLMQNFSLIVPDDPRILIQGSDGSIHQIEVPIRPKNSKKLGKVISSVYSNIDTIQNHYLGSITQIDIAVKNNIGNQPAIFVLETKPEILQLLDQTTILRAKDVIHELDWQAKEKGYEVFKAYEPLELTEKVLYFTGIPKQSESMNNNPNFPKQLF